VRRECEDGEGKREALPLGHAERKGIKRLLERRSMDFSSSPRKSRGTEAVLIGTAPPHTPTHRTHEIDQSPKASTNLLISWSTGSAPQKSARNTDWSTSFARVLDSLRCSDGT
jgi:hypothetical protein